MMDITVITSLRKTSRNDCTRLIMKAREFDRMRTPNSVLWPTI
jgi:hypothetical protein